MVVCATDRSEAMVLVSILFVYYVAHYCAWYRGLFVWSLISVFTFWRLVTPCGEERAESFACLLICFVLLVYFM